MKLNHMKCQHFIWFNLIIFTKEFLIYGSILIIRALSELISLLSVTDFIFKNYNRASRASNLWVKWWSNDSYSFEYYRHFENLTENMDIFPKKMCVLTHTHTHHFAYSSIKAIDLFIPTKPLTPLPENYTQKMKKALSNNFSHFPTFEQKNNVYFMIYTVHKLPDGCYYHQ